MNRLVFLCAFLAVTSARAQDHFVIIDPGHGGKANSGTQAARTLSSSNNATSPSGLKEKDLTLQLSLEIKRQIAELAQKRKIKVAAVLTRGDDSNPDFAKRAALCASVNPAAIVSIHFNASTGHDALGTVALVPQAAKNPNFPADQKFARGLTNATSIAVQKFLPASKPRAPITDAHLHDGAGSNFFLQLATHKKFAGIPKCFLEIEFIDRADVDEKLLKPRNKTFPEIARAIAEHLYAHCETP